MAVSERTFLTMTIAIFVLLAVTLAIQLVVMSG